MMQGLIIEERGIQLELERQIKRTMFFFATVCAPIFK